MRPSTRAMLIATTLCLVYPSKNCLGVELEQVKLDLSALNRLKQQDLQRIQRRTAIIAHFEARLENCGTYPHFERHATAAATACLTPELLAHLSQVYSGAKKFQADFIFPISSSPIWCCRTETAVRT